MTSFSDRLKAFISGRNPHGCSAAEIASLKSRATSTLPDSYLQFMEMAGNGVDDFLTGSDIFLRDLEGMREAAEELLQEAGLPPLPQDAFVFSMHQGYQFYFFHNAGVYYFHEGAKEILKRYDSFDDFFESVVDSIYKTKHY